MAQRPSPARALDPPSPASRGLGGGPAGTMSTAPETPVPARGRGVTEGDLGYFTERVYRMLERKIQIERERKGWHG